MGPAAPDRIGRECYRAFVRRHLLSLSPLLIWALLLLGMGTGMLCWLGRNPFPDGYQNEYLHVGNAYALWEALCALDSWHLRYYVATNYWPPLFYIVPWPLLSLGESWREALVMSNLVWLALGLFAVYKLAAGRLAGAAAMFFFVFSPGIFGSLVRYEPNVAQASCVALTLLALHRSQGLRRPGWSLATGGLLALGLLTDRLGTLPFLALPLLLALYPSRLTPAQGASIAGATSGSAPRSGRRRIPWRGALLLTLATLVLAGPWYLQWALTQLEEVTSQLAVGEIDSAGSFTELEETSAAIRWFYYPLVLLDSQAGPLLGSAMLLALFWPPARRRASSHGSTPRGHHLLLATVIGGWALFTCIQKKQVFYTLPLLAPLSVLAGRLLARTGALRGLLLLLLLSAGLHQYGWRLWDRGWPLLRQLGEPDPLPAAWVFPRHALARPPSDQQVPVEALCQALQTAQGDVVIFSEDPRFYEGFLVLMLRQCQRSWPVRGLRGDPQGTYEWFRASDSFLHVADGSARGWPTASAMEGALLGDHYDLAELPPVIEMIVEDAPAWSMSAEWELEDGASARLWRR